MGDLPKLRERLEAIKAEFEAELAAMEVPNRGVEGTSTSPADGNFEAAMLCLPIRICRKALLRQVQAALTRLEQGTYGVCKQCGEDIAPERLEVMPYATLCIGCAEKLEKRGG